ncbi:hypothetical protein BLL52_0289 [Rhodoferax antarcticus ANT.BR]|uniref:Uncharacterized protein n=1 Tax=Rhodoferax antarcticus ANT.BR TaxID=1111071 RepID=A0A1Q8YKU9_9BURK|nr:hypothetical protein BLL52_0289 [Rhodoferax antarcticus ANT.BR]
MTAAPTCRLDPDHSALKYGSITCFVAEGSLLRTFWQTKRAKYIPQRFTM